LENNGSDVRFPFILFNANLLSFSSSPKTEFYIGIPSSQRTQRSGKRKCGAFRRKLMTNRERYKTFLPTLLQPTVVTLLPLPLLLSGSSIKWATPMLK
jgi:hypothetical protein